MIVSPRIRESAKIAGGRVAGVSRRASTKTDAALQPSLTAWESRVLRFPCVARSTTGPAAPSSGIMRKGRKVRFERGGAEARQEGVKGEPPFGRPPQAQDGEKLTLRLLDRA